MAGWLWSPGPIAIVQLGPEETAKTGALRWASMRTATWSGPLKAATPFSWGMPFGVFETSRSAGASNTTQTASPRRKTAAPAGLAQGKVSSTWPLAAFASMRTTPPAGTGSGRTGSGSTGGRAACCDGSGGGLAKAFR
jgi:hypothetical protein